jgi:hypothetical protein
MEDDLSIATPPVGCRNSDNDHELLSKTIRFNFAPVDRTRIDSVDPSAVHIQWLRIIASAFGNDVKIINNYNKIVSNITNQTQTTKGTSHEQQFKIHQKSVGGVDSSGTTKTAFTIVHRILIRVPFGQIKRHQSAFQLLKDNNCYLREHMWDEQEWDVQQIGFVTGYNPKYYTPEKVMTSLRARLTNSNVAPRIKLPKFQAVLKTHKILHHERSSSTQAYTIEVPTHSATQLISIMKEATKDTKEYVPFQMRRRNPDAFQGAIRYQNHILANQRVVMIHNLGMDAMYYLTDRIQAIAGVQDVIPTKKVSQNGKFYVLVTKAEENKVRQSLQTQFDGWYHEVVPDDAKPQDGQFEGPPGLLSGRPDGYSSGENSWMTTSTKSFMEYSVASMESTTSNEDGSRLDRAWDNRTAETTQSTTQTLAHRRSSERTYASYAAATVSDQVSGMTESDTPRDVRHEELTNKIATLEAMIERLCHQVQALTKSAEQQQRSPDPEDTANQHRGKRTDRKDSPRKHKQHQQHSAPSGIEEDMTEPAAPMDEDRLTVWDDYLPHNDDDDL